MPGSNRFSSKVQEFDAFAHAFRFRLPNGEKEYRSWKGVCFTLVLAVTLSVYGLMQLNKLFEFDETDVMVSTKYAYFEDDFVYSEDLWYAFGITSYDNDRNPVEDPTIGVLKAFSKSWGGIDGSDEHGVKWTELSVRECTEAELHING